MLGYAVIGAAALLVVKLIAFVKSVFTMRKVDRRSAVFALGINSGFFKILDVIGFDSRPKRPSSDVRLSLSKDTSFDTLAEVYNLKIRKDDVFVASYPKSGTTWTQEIVWLITNDANVQEAKKRELDQRFPFMDAIDILPAKCYGLQTVERWPKNKRRLIKTHLPFGLLPGDMWKGEKRKIVYVARNPKDVCVSFYFFHLAFNRLQHPGTFDEFFEKFCRGEVYSGCWFSHCLTYWKESKIRPKEIYFITYEALTKNLKGEVASLAKFLERDLSEEQIDTIANHCTFGNMSKNPKVNLTSSENAGFDFKISKFMRKGKIGDWKNYFTVNQSLFYDEMYHQKIKDTDLVLEFEKHP